MLSVLQSDRFPSGVQGQKRRLQAHRPTHLKWGDLTFGADYPVRMLGLTLDLCFLRSGGLPSWQSFQSVV